MPTEIVRYNNKENILSEYSSGIFEPNMNVPASPKIQIDQQNIIRINILTSTTSELKKYQMCSKTPNQKNQNLSGKTIFCN